jgi:hypothetical protein
MFVENEFSTIFAPALRNAITSKWRGSSVG